MAKSVMVIGLGRFGLSVAEELIKSGVDVLGVDSSDRVVSECASLLTDAAVADTTTPTVLDQLGIRDFDRVVIGIGSDLENSILTAFNVVESGVTEVWAKADSEAHARILRQIGVTHVIHPERDTGRRVAHLLGGRIHDFVEFDHNYGMVMLTVGNRVPEPNRRRPIDIVSVKRDGAWIPSDGTLRPGDHIIAAGAPKDLDKFAKDAGI